MKFKQTFAEMPIHEWDGHYVRVQVSLPIAPHTMTTQMVIDRDDIEALRHLHLPEHLKVMSPEEVNLWIRMNDHKREKAKQVVETIAQKVSRHLANAVAKALNEGNHG